MHGGLGGEELRREVAQIERVAIAGRGGGVWRLLCIYMGRCPIGQINRGGNKMAKKTLKKSKKLEATKPLTVSAIAPKR
jgi:hypothetical protein